MKTVKKLIAATVIMGLLLAAVSGCALLQGEPTRPATTAPTTASTQPSSTSAEPSVTDPPVTAPTVTEPTVTEPTVTEPTVTEPPITEPPATEPPVEEPSDKPLTVCIDAGHQRYGISEKEYLNLLKQRRQ